MTSFRTFGFDRYTRIAELGVVVHSLLRRGVVALGLLLGAATALLYYTENPGWQGFLLMAIGTVVALAVWRNRATGLPLVPTLAIQHLIAYGVPIVNEHETLGAYPAEFVTQAGGEVCIFLIALALAWRACMEFFRPGSAEAFVLKVFHAGEAGSVRIGLTLVLITTAYQLLVSLNLIDVVLALLPSGTFSLVTALINATTLAGYFLLAMLVGARDVSPLIRVVFWTTLAANLLLMSSAFLLSSSIGLVTAVLIGLFWSSGRIPWRFLFVVLGFISFLQLGKFDMRERYWENEEDETSGVVSLSDLPDRYSEWVDVSYRNLIGSEDPTSPLTSKKKENATMLDRVNNLQNLLYAINAVDAQRVPLLEGETYALIPPLLIPRVFWPEKPRSHEGQILLNVHFGRQSLAATFKTYIAWGLLPEAYGNFGSIWGAAILGVGLGVIFAWLESATANKPLLSLEGLVTFAVFSSVAISFEMVSTVLVTSIFQTSIVISLACMPFVERLLILRPSGDRA